MDWNVTFEEITYFIEHYLLALLALAFAYTIAVKKLTAFNVSLILLILLNILHQHLTTLFIGLWSKPEYAELAFYLWYISFSVTDFIYVAICLSIMQNLNLMRDRATLYILVAKGGQGLLQLGMMCSELISPNSLDHLYSTLIITLNIFMATMVIIMAMRVVLARFGFVSLTAKE